MPAKIISTEQWGECAQLSNGQAEVLVSIATGPRIVSYKVGGSGNVLASKGGHRLWVAPETERTYSPEVTPLFSELTEPAGVRVGNPAAAPWHIRKEMTVSLAAENSAVMIEHRLTNQGEKPERIASWGLTIMEPGGIEIIPQPPLGEHGPGNFLPSRVMVLWSYTDLSDDRWRIGKQFITLQPKKGRPATKLGLSHQSRWVGYIVGERLFIKTFMYEDGAVYPDLGCNYETFTKDDFIELESLSPLRELAPGQSVSHTETWHLFGGISAPDPLDESALAEWLAPFLTKTGLL